MNSKNRLSQENEESLVKMASTGVLDAFNQLVLRYQDMAYNHAYALLGESSLAEDAVQEGFIKAFQALNTFRGGSFRAWLLRIVTNVCYDNFRRSRRYSIQPLVPEDEEGDDIESPSWLADPSTSIQETVEKREEMDALYRLLDELPEIYRTAITLIDLNELDYSEAARALNIPVGTLKSRLTRARLQVRDKFQHDSVYFTKVVPAPEGSFLCTNAVRVKRETTLCLS